MREAHAFGVQGLELVGVRIHTIDLLDLEAQLILAAGALGGVRAAFFDLSRELAPLPVQTRDLRAQRAELAVAVE